MDEKKPPTIAPNRLVKSYEYGNTLELTTSTGHTRQTILVLPKRQYMVIETGEVKQMNTDAKNRQDNLRSVKMMMRKLRRLIYHNFSSGKTELWITLTYREHITDPVRAYQDFKIFMAKTRKQFGTLEYIAVIEPQASGRWHFHVLVKSRETLVIPNETAAKLWSKGFTSTKRIKRSDKIGNYVLAYVSNLDLLTDETTKEKKYIKGARLYLYPKGIRIYRCSKGIKRPIERTDQKQDILKEYDAIHLTFSKASKHKTSTGDTIIYVTEFYHHLNKEV